MASVNSTEDEVDNPYLVMREAKIARNHKRLSELGLLKPPPPPPLLLKHKQQSQLVNKKSQQLLLRNEPVRRSSRISNLEKQSPNYKEVVPLLQQHSGKRTREKTPEDNNSPYDASRKTRGQQYYCVASTNEAIQEVLVPAPPAPHLKANSVRSISLDVNYLVLGHSLDHCDGLLGKMMDRPGKDYVIHKAFAKAASSEDRERLTGETNAKLSFNKYSGVQEWMNCTFLWVNLGGKDSVNEFIKDGKIMTWYGGSRMHESSPLFRKLRSLDSEIVLWCRKYNSDMKSLSPYVCFGRVKYLWHKPGSHPIQFEWELDDSDDLRFHRDSARVQTYLNFTQENHG